MGTKAQELLSIDRHQVIELLNKAYADEWLAYYQYWIGAKVARGLMRDAVIAELEQHANEELGHAGVLANRIIQLGGEPALSPSDWAGLSNCGYAAPSDPAVIRVLEQNIKGEQCAIDVYFRLLETIRGKDAVTAHMIMEILEDEEEHEQDLQDLLEDIRGAQK
jgi:bacterioferritin